MNMFRASCATALVVVLAQTGSAFALDPEAAARAFLSGAQTAASKSVVTFGSATMSGSDVVVTDVETKTEVDGEIKGGGTFAEVRLSNVSETGNGQYAADSAVYSDGQFNMEGNISIVIPEMDVQGLKTRDSTGDAVPMPVTYRSFASGDIRVNIPDPKMTVTIARLEANMDEFAGDVPKSGNISITGINVPIDAIPAGPTSPQQLGYNGDLMFSITANGKARYESSGFALDDLTIAGDNMGSLSIALDMDNYPNLLNTAEPNPMAMMGVTLRSVSLKYTDDSLAGRILELMAKQNGMTREQYAQQMSMALPFMLNVINNPEFQRQVADAAGSFLNDPGTIEVNVKPSKPMSAMEIIGIAQSAPQTLPDQLNVTVQAR